MFRRATAALARRGFAAGVRDTAGGARDVVAAVSELRLPAALEARAEAERAAARARGGSDEAAPVNLPVQLAPYQALPVDGRITRHFTRGLPVVDPSSRTQAVRHPTQTECGPLLSAGQRVHTHAGGARTARTCWHGCIAARCAAGSRRGCAFAPRFYKPSTRPRECGPLSRPLRISPAQERERAVDSIITAYTARLKERTKHHLGCVCKHLSWRLSGRCRPRRARAARCTGLCGVATLAWFSRGRAAGFWARSRACDTGSLLDSRSCPQLPLQPGL
jgi:hypothetical protein